MKAQERSRRSGSWWSPGWAERKGNWSGGPSTGTSNSPGVAARARPALHRPVGASCGTLGAGLWDVMTSDGADGSCVRRHFGWTGKGLRLIGQQKMRICEEDAVCV